MTEGRSRDHEVDVVFATTAVFTTNRFVHPVAREMADRGWRVHLVAGDALPREAGYEFTASQLPMSRDIALGTDVHSLRDWVTLLRTLRPRMLVAGTPKASLLSLTAARMTRTPSRVYVIHGAVWDGAGGRRGQVLRAAERVTLSAATQRLAVSESLAELVYANKLARAGSIDVVGAGSFCGVDMEVFQPDPQRQDPIPTICFVGRLHRDKGLPVILRVLRQVQAVMPVRLLLIGGKDDASPDLDSALEVLSADPDVECLGPTKDVAGQLQRAWVLLLPTKREGLPQVVLEAQASGVPTVSWRATGLPDAMADGVTGRLVDFGDEDALAQAVIDVLADPELRRELGSQARAWTRDRFDTNLVVPRVADYLEQAMQSPAGR